MLCCIGEVTEVELGTSLITYGYPDACTGLIFSTDDWGLLRLVKIQREKTCWCLAPIGGGCCPYPPVAHCIAPSFSVRVGLCHFPTPGEALSFGFLIAVCLCLKCTFFFTPGDKRTDNELTGTMVIQVTNRSTAIQLPDKEICFNSSSQGQL